VRTNVRVFDKFRVNATLADLLQVASAFFCQRNEATVKPRVSRYEIW
jgi:hypothetical protein